MDTPRLNVISVCTGLAGLDAAFGSVLTARTVCYVEVEAFCIEHLVQKMQAGKLDEAPIWTNLATFDGKPWRHAVDCVIGGIPCQPHSLAGKRKGSKDERDLVDEFVRVVSEVGPSLVFVENVRGFISGDGLGRLLGGLAELGFDAEWGTLRASDVGAPHRRERCFVLADPAGDRRREGRPESAGEFGGFDASERGGPGLADTNGRGREQQWSGSLFDRERETRRHDTDRRHAFPPGPNDSAEWKAYLERHPGLEPAVRRSSPGLSNRVDRLRALGNAVVPQQAAAALRGLIERIDRT